MPMALLSFHFNIIQMLFLIRNFFYQNYFFLKGVAWFLSNVPLSPMVCYMMMLIISQSIPLYGINENLIWRFFRVSYCAL